MDASGHPNSFSTLAGATVTNAPRDSREPVPMSPDKMADFEENGVQSDGSGEPVTPKPPVLPRCRQADWYHVPHSSTRSASSAGA